MVIWQVKEFCQLNIKVEAPEIHIYTYGTVDSVMGLLLRGQHPLRLSYVETKASRSNI